MQLNINFTIKKKKLKNFYKSERERERVENRISRTSEHSRLIKQITKKISTRPSPDAPDAAGQINENFIYRKPSN
ncbi:hypothetical protein BpHYR1_001445 [Brachionus plicatilis]|uniref:Uncharacterized protein n=1 Tax=Brachionus plicatilis TaxID=10195 RepID=A0A3M7PIV0_BRAPC|nr:hypothetical protein BpHYR1_001445 [Brachionus plicatilis]